MKLIVNYRTLEIDSIGVKSFSHGETTLNYDQRLFIESNNTPSPDGSYSSLHECVLSEIRRRIGCAMIDIKSIMFLGDHEYDLCISIEKNKD